MQNFGDERTCNFCLTSEDATALCSCFSFFFRDSIRSCSCLSRCSRSSTSRCFSQSSCTNEHKFVDHFERESEGSRRGMTDDRCTFRCCRSCCSCCSANCCCWAWKCCNNICCCICCCFFSCKMREHSLKTGEKGVNVKRRDGAHTCRICCWMACSFILFRFRRSFRLLTVGLLPGELPVMSRNRNKSNFRLVQGKRVRGHFDQQKRNYDYTSGCQTIAAKNPRTSKNPSVRRTSPKFFSYFDVVWKLDDFYKNKISVRYAS